MRDDTAALAHAITRTSSKQSYYTALLLVDRDLVDDCCRAYAYFRWADDIIDLSDNAPEKRIAFIERQKSLVDKLYAGERPGDLAPEEQMLADLINRDRGENSGLQSFIRRFLKILEFDAHRKGKLIEGAELSWYSQVLGRSVTDAIQYFVANDHRYPEDRARYLSATAAHMSHMLRDTYNDLADGFVNIPREYLEAYDLSPSDIDSLAYRAWVQERVAAARELFREGKKYLDRLAVLRCKIAAYWYCARFECVLNAIEKDGFVLRSEYKERRGLKVMIRMVWLALVIAVKHMMRLGPMRSARSRESAISNDGSTFAEGKSKQGIGA